MNIRQWSYSDSFSLAGLFVWLFVILIHPGRFGETFWTIQMLVLLAILIIVPLGLGLLTRQSEDESFRLLKDFSLPFQLAVFIMGPWFFQFDSGFASACWSIPWLVQTAFMALAGMMRLASRRSLRPLDKLCEDFALMFIAVGGVWLVASRAGINFLGFSHVIVLLTAMHFHFAGFGATLMAGQLGKHIDQASPFYRFAVSGVILATPMLALGITFSPLLEVIAAFYLALALIVMAGLMLGLAWRTPGPGIRILFSLSALALMAAMGAAMLYAWGEFVGEPHRVPIPTMVMSHGLLNGLLSVPCGLTGFWLLQKRTRSSQSSS